MCGTHSTHGGDKQNFCRNTYAYLTNPSPCNQTVILPLISSKYIFPSLEFLGKFRCLTKNS